MARPAKSARLRSGHQTKEEKENRERVEDAFGGGEAPVVPKELTKAQKKIFEFITSSLPQNLLCSLDVFILTIAAISIDRVQTLEFAMNRVEKGKATETEISNIKNLSKLREQYMRDFFRCCNELCLSPQSRAKIGSAAAAAQTQQQDPLVKILGKLGGG